MLKALQQDGIAASYRKASFCDHDSNNLQAFQDTAYAISFDHQDIAQYMNFHGKEEDKRKDE